MMMMTYDDDSNQSINQSINLFTHKKDIHEKLFTRLKHVVII